MIEINVTSIKYVVMSLSKKFNNFMLIPKNVIWSDTVEEDMDGLRATWRLSTLTRACR